MSTGKELALAYFEGLKDAYLRQGPKAKEEWDRFASVVRGAEQSDLNRLNALYPDTPESLIELLKLVDGTYYRDYPDGEVLFYFLGSDYEGYPYYLLSARQMVETRHEAKEFYDYLVNREFDDIPVDEGVCDDLDKLDWLHISDCMNNGGTSQLFIDFSPSAKGKKGQVLRFLHDPDEMVVVADSFDEYLQMLIDQNYAFINEDTIED